MSTDQVETPSNVVPLMPIASAPDEPLPQPASKPDDGVIRMLEDLLERARNGGIGYMAGIGFLDGGQNFTFRCGSHNSLFEIRGALKFLDEEFAGEGRREPQRAE